MLRSRQQFEESERQLRKLVDIATVWSVFGTYVLAKTWYHSVSSAMEKL